MCVPLIVNTFVRECVCWRDNKHDLTVVLYKYWLDALHAQYTHTQQRREIERERKREVLLTIK